jgi:diguanylate cyclase (GGDEF)-like protein
MRASPPKTPELLEVTDVRDIADPLEGLVATLPDAALVYDEDGWVMANDLALALFEVDSLEQLRELSPLDWFHPGCRDSARRRLELAIRSYVRSGPQDDTLVLGGGASCQIETSVGTVIHRGQSAALCLMRPVRRAMTDPLTGLPTRELLMDRLAHALTQIGRRGGFVAVVTLDVDRFQLVNDSLGHSVGDRLLEQIARRLNTTIRAGDTLARFGGDEFIVMCDCVAGVADAERLAVRLRQALQQPFRLEGEDFHVSATMGLALGTSDDTAESVLRDSDAALRQAKAADRSATGVFADELRAKALARLDTESALRRAVDGEELVLYYQPIVTVESGRISGFEALVRWPRGGVVVSPADFVPVAEETGLILPMGRLVLKLAIEQIARWHERGFDVPFVGVNLSPRQLVDVGLADYVASELARNRVSPEHLCLEITESRLMQNLEMARATLNQLRELGTPLAIDDFGTGYSSLAQLRTLPFSRLKIDQWFVSDLETGVGGERLFRGVLELADSLSMSVVAEGVETVAQLDALRRLGCQSAQGYHFARPMPALGAGELLERPHPAFAV